MDARLSFLNFDGIVEPERRRLESVLNVTDAVEFLCVEDSHPLPKCTPRFLDHERQVQPDVRKAMPVPTPEAAQVRAPSPIPVTKPVTVEVLNCNGDFHKSHEPEVELQSPTDIPKTNGAPEPPKQVRLKFCVTTLNREMRTVPFFLSYKLCIFVLTYKMYFLLLKGL